MSKLILIGLSFITLELTAMEKPKNPWDPATPGQALVFASMKGKLEETKEFLKLNLSAKYITESLYYSAARGHVEIVRLLLTEAKADPNGVYLNITPLLVATLNDHNEIVNLLIDNGASVNICHQRTSQTPLMHACFKGNLILVKKFIECGADVNALDYQNRTVLSVISEGLNKQPITNYLLEKLKK